ncbi:MAG: hypothetical protein PHV02_11480 [Rhodocyclaceae bacterium]|nr:hypothetical protein [Rhodocyclaceae bacterium]
MLFKWGIEVRRWLLAAVAAFTFGVHAADQGSDSFVSFALPEADGVVITAIPAPTLVLQMDLRDGAELRPIKRAKSAKKLKQAKLKALAKSLPKSMLSRTERHQMALMVAAKPQTSGHAALLHLFDDGDAGSGPEDIDLHRFFSRPRVVEIAELEVGDNADDELSDAIKLRLLIARTRAVQAHEKKFS